MHKPNEKTRLNHFILWCKGWYKTTNDEMTLFDEAKLALSLDEYIFCRSNTDVLSIVSRFIDEFNEYLVSIDKKPYSQYDLVRDLYQNMIYGFSYEESILMAYRNFLGFDTSRKDILLEPPTYSKALRKKGFVHENKIGMTYKQANNYAKKFFQKISTK